MVLLAGGLDLHLLDCRVLVHLDQVLLVLALHLVPNVDEALLDHVELLGALSVERLALTGVLLLDAVNLPFMFADQLLRLLQQLLPCNRHVHLPLLLLQAFDLLFEYFGLFIEANLGKMLHFAFQIKHFNSVVDSDYTCVALLNLQSEVIKLGLLPFLELHFK